MRYLKKKREKTQKLKKKGVYNLPLVAHNVVVAVFVLCLDICFCCYCLLHFFCVKPS